VIPQDVRQAEQKWFLHEEIADRVCLHKVFGFQEAKVQPPRRARTTSQVMMLMTLDISMLF
jgi:hypothetical protein